jgi:hypothetical protein
MLTRDLLSKDYFGFNEYIKEGLIHFPQDIRIAYFNLDDDGQEEFFYMCMPELRAAQQDAISSFGKKMVVTGKI